MDELQMLALKGTPLEEPQALRQLLRQLPRPGGAPDLGPDDQGCVDRMWIVMVSDEVAALERQVAQEFADVALWTQEMYESVAC